MKLCPESMAYGNRLTWYGQLIKPSKTAGNIPIWDIKIKVWK